MNQDQKIPKYADLIKKIKKRKKITVVITVIAIIAVFIFGSPSTSTYTVNGVTETVTSEGLPTVVLVLLFVLCLFISFIILAFIMNPLNTAMDQECDPEKQLILYLNLSKKTPSHIYLQDYLYLGNYSEAIKYADKMIGDRRKAYSIVGLFQKARCAFFLEDIDMLKETVSKYDQELLGLKRQKEKHRLSYERLQTILHMLCALSEHDSEKIAALRDQLAPWNSNKSVESFIQYLKGLVAFELGETKEAEFRFRLVADQYPKLILARLSNEYLEKLSEEDTATQEDSVSTNESSEQATEETIETTAESLNEPIVINPNDWIIPQTNRPKPRGSQRAISILLFIASICSIWGALMGVAILSANDPGTLGTENMWVFFLFLPIPIASIAYGFYLKKKGVKYKKNVIVGFIMATFLCLYGSFTFIFDDVYSHSEEPILNAEQTLNIDIPAHTRINTHDWSQGTQSVSRGYIYYTSDIYFDDTAVAEFEKNLESDTKWMSYIPNDMIGITSYLYDMESSDYYLIYNKTTKEFNSLPSESGTYDLINILYNAESNTMTLVEYQIEYTK